MTVEKKERRERRNSLLRDMRETKRAAGRCLWCSCDAQGYVLCVLCASRSRLSQKKRDGKLEINHDLRVGDVLVSRDGRRRMVIEVCDHEVRTRMLDTGATNYINNAGRYAVERSRT